MAGPVLGGGPGECDASYCFQDGLHPSLLIPWVLGVSRVVGTAGAVAAEEVRGRSGRSWYRQTLVEWMKESLVTSGGEEGMMKYNKSPMKVVGEVVEGRYHCEVNTDYASLAAAADYLNDCVGCTMRRRSCPAVQ